MQEQGQKPHVCRRLFADDAEPADPGAHDNLINQINEEIKRSLDDARKKYNFDFRSEVPLEGDWVWERFDSQSPLGLGDPQGLSQGGDPPSVEPPSDQPPSEPQQPPADSEQKPAGP